MSCELSGLRFASVLAFLCAQALDLRHFVASTSHLCNGGAQVELQDVVHLQGSLEERAKDCNSQVLLLVLFSEIELHIAISRNQQLPWTHPRELPLLDLGCSQILHIFGVHSKGLGDPPPVGNITQVPISEVPHWAEFYNDLMDLDRIFINHMLV